MEQDYHDNANSSPSKKNSHSQILPKKKHKKNKIHHSRSQILSKIDSPKTKKGKKHLQIKSKHSKVQKDSPNNTSKRQKENLKIPQKQTQEEDKKNQRSYFSESLRKKKEISDRNSQHKRISKEILENARLNDYNRLIIYFPKVVILFEIVIVLLCLLFILKSNLLELTEITFRDYLIFSDEKTKKWDAIAAAEEKIDEDLAERTNIEKQSQLIEDWRLFVVYETNDGSNLWTPENIIKIANFEAKMMEFDKMDLYCMQVASSEDSSVKTNYIRSVYSTLNQTVGSETLFAATLAQIYSVYKVLFGDDAEDEPISRFGRSIIEMAAPISDGKFDDKTDNYKEQERRYREFIYDFLEWVEDYKLEGITAKIASQSLLYSIHDVMLATDIYWAIGSFLVVLAYITIHVRSSFLSVFGMMQVIFTLPISLVFYKELYNISYFSSLHMVVVFVILGISADKIFIYTDCYYQTQKMPEIGGNLVRQISYVSNRSMKATLVTTLTCFMAFIATGISKIMPISSFGFFAATVVAMNYLMTISFYPSLLVLYAKHIENKCCTLPQIKKYVCSCLFPSGQNPQQETTTSKNKTKPNPTNNSMHHPSLRQFTDEKNCEEDLSAIKDFKMKVELFQEFEKKKDKGMEGANEVLENTLRNIDSAPTEERDEPKFGVIESFCSQKWNYIIYKARIPIVIIFGVWIVFCIYRATCLKSLSESEKFLPEDLDSYEALINVREDFHKGVGDIAIQVDFVWGVKGIDKDGTDYYDPTDLGEPIWDNDFYFNSAQSQQRFIEICETIRSNPLVVDDSSSVTCFMEDFKAYVEADAGKSFPVEDPTEFEELFTAFMTTTTTGASLVQDYKIGIIGDKVALVQIRAIAALKPYLPRKVTFPVYEQFEELKNKLNKDSPEGMNKAFQTARLNWAWLETEKSLITSAVQGMIISIIFAFIILTFSTLNVVIAGYAALSISGIIVCVMAVMEFNGWEFGIIESVGCVVLIGFSVDYIVHLGNHYVESLELDRYSRMKDALTKIGISVLGGAITTFGSGIFLFCCALVLFFKFAVLITTTISYSFVFALVFFTAFCHLFGPQKNFGSLGYWLKKYCCKKNKEPKYLSKIAHNITHKQTKGKTSQNKKEPHFEAVLGTDQYRNPNTRHNNQ